MTDNRSNRLWNDKQWGKKTDNGEWQTIGDDGLWGMTDNGS